MKPSTPISTVRKIYARRAGMAYEKVILSFKRIRIDDDLLLLDLKLQDGDLIRVSNKPDEDNECVKVNYDKLEENQSPNNTSQEEKEEVLVEEHSTVNIEDVLDKVSFTIKPVKSGISLMPMPLTMKPSTSISTVKKIYARRAGMAYENTILSYKMKRIDDDHQSLLDLNLQDGDLIRVKRKKAGPLLKPGKQSLLSELLT